MKNIFSPFKQQIIGIFNLSLPILFFAWAYPTVIITEHGKLICSFLLGFYVWYMNYKTTRNQAKILKFIPTGESKNAFDKLIHACNINPQTINLRYGYTNEMLAMAMFNTVVVDPLLWLDVEEDPEFIKVTNILKEHVLPTLPALQKERLEKIKQVFTPSIQCFIFRHELAHVIYNYSTKKLLLMGITGFITAYTGISVAVALKHLGGIAIVIGMLAAGVIDLFISYGSNVFFKSFAEKNADAFAAQYSSCEEIEAAAEFFEQLQDIQNVHKDPNNILATLPSIVLSGHLDGKSRGQFLRKLAAKKMC